MARKHREASGTALQGRAAEPRVAGGRGGRRRLAAQYARRKSGAASGVPVVNDTVAEFHEGVSYALPVFSRVLGVTLEGVSLVFSCDHGTIDILS
jgi:hypothetical protein